MFKNNDEYNYTFEYTLITGEVVTFGASASTNDDYLQMADGRVIYDYDEMEDLLGPDYDRITDIRLDRDELMQAEKDQAEQDYLEDCYAETAYMHSGMYSQWYGNVR